MPRKTEPTFEWRGDRWHPRVSRAIEQRLLNRREALAKALRINLDQYEWRTNPASDQSENGGPSSAAYFEWRQTKRTRGGPVALVDLAVEEIASALRVCWALYRDVNRAASTTQLFHNLNALLAEPNNVLDLWLRCDPETRAWIEDFYPGGWMAMGDEPDPDLLMGAIKAARSALAEPAAHRPPGTKNVALASLAPALAHVFQDFSGSEPTRRYDFYQDAEYGPFHDFCRIVLGVIPRRLRRGSLANVDRFARTAIERMHDPIIR